MSTAVHNRWDWWRLPPRFWITASLLTANWCWVREAGLYCIGGYEFGLIPYFKFNTLFQSEVDWLAVNATIVMSFAIVLRVKYWPVRREIDDELPADQVSE
jgi:hypothetical protein